MTAEELILFQNEYRNSEAKNQTDFVLRLLKEKPITVNYELVAILAELKRQGNNLNQIARRLNEYQPYDETAKKVLDECWFSYKKLLEIGGQK